MNNYKKGDFYKKHALGGRVSVLVYIQSGESFFAKFYIYINLHTPFLDTHCAA